MKIEVRYIILASFVFWGCGRSESGINSTKRLNEMQKVESNIETQEKCFLESYRLFLDIKKKSQKTEMVEFILLGSELVKTCRLNPEMLNKLVSKTDKFL